LQFVDTSICSSRQNTIIKVEKANTINKETFGEYLRYYRIEKNLSQQDLSELTGISRSFIDSIEKDNHILSKDTLLKLNKVFDIYKFPLDDYYKFILQDTSEYFKSWRSKNKLSLRAAANILNVPHSTLRYWEKGNIINKETYLNIKSLLK
jgi:transcriptional regulator with XRE-family HTH domain